MWGTYSLGLFATGQFGAPTPTGADNSAGSVVAGLFYGGGTGQLVAQLIGNTSICLGVFVVSMVLMYAVKATGTLRVSKEGELEGLDLHEHGGEAYPEAVTSHYGHTSAVGRPAPEYSSAAATATAASPAA
jgi:Amt family ammonium transporter